MYKSLSEHKFLFFLGKYLGVQWLGHVVGVYLTFWETVRTVFLSESTILHFHHLSGSIPSKWVFLLQTEISLNEKEDQAEN